MKKTNEEISLDRINYLKKIKKEKLVIFLTQIGLIIFLLIIWELLANLNIIDSFVTSKPSRIWQTFINFGSNDLIKHIKVTFFETVIGFILGTSLGIIIAIVLWWSKFLAKVFDPYLVVLNSLPKVALRSNNNYMGRCRDAGYNCYGYCNF